MRAAHGYIVWSDAKEPRELEMDTVTCAHCNRVVFVKMDMSNVGFCLKCTDHLCTACAGLGTCLPFERALEQFERGITKRLLTDATVSAILGGK